MKTVTIHEAKTHLSRLVQEAVSGEEIVIARGRQPMVRLVPVPESTVQRRFGTARGLLRMSDDFDDAVEDFSDYT